MKKIILAVTIGAGLFALSSMAEHHETAQEPNVATPGTHRPMDAQVSCAMAKEQEVAKLVDDLLKSFAAIRSEKDPMILNREIDTHEALLKQLQSKLQGHSRMMNKMPNTMGGQMPREKTTTADPAAPKN